MRNRLLSPATLWLVLFGVLNLFVSGRWTFALAAWVAPAFGLRYLYVHPQRRKFLYFYLVLWLTLAVPWYGATPFFGPAHYIFMLVTALVGVVPYIADRWLAPRLRRHGRLPFVATLIFPLAGTALEFLLSATNPIGNFGAVGYSQYALPALTQVTAVTGMLGLAFLVSWFPAVLNWAWDHEFAWARVRNGVAAFALTLALVLGYGFARLAAAPEIGVEDTVTVASFTLVETHMGELNELLAQSGKAAYRRETRAVHEQYLAMTETAIADGASIVLWPELAVTGVAEDVQAAVAAGQALARDGSIYLGMPTFTIYPDSQRASENVLFMAGPDGRIVLEHVKYGGNFLEGTVPGDGRIEAVDTPYGRLAGIICWDTNFPAVVRQVGQQQADFLLSPAKEWAGINPMHAEMAAFRAIENGTAVIRQADEGLSIVVDGYGRTLATGEGVAGSGNYLLVQVPTSSPTTLYSRLGDVVGLLSAAGLVLMAAYALIGNRRRQSAEAPEAAAAS